MQKKLYQSVFDGIVQRIVGGDYAPGIMLPSEFEIADAFGVSQGTARKALIELEKKGIVERRQGKGTFVTLRTPENSLFHFFRLRDAHGNQVAPDLMDEKIRVRKATTHEHERLFGQPEEVFEISRVRSFEQKPLCHELSVVSVSLFPGLIERAPLPNTLYVLFQQAYGCAIISARDKLRAKPAGAVLGAALGVDPEVSVIAGSRESLDLLERVIELRDSVYLTENVHYSVVMD